MWPITLYQIPFTVEHNPNAHMGPGLQAAVISHKNCTAGGDVEPYSRQQIVVQIRVIVTQRSLGLLTCDSSASVISLLHEAWSAKCAVRYDNARRQDSIGLI